MSEAMKARLNCEVTGIEVCEEAAELARQHCRQVLVGDAEVMDFEAVLATEQFDAIIFADVLEHLRDPGEVLRKTVKLLSNEGAIVASIPNIAHSSMRLGLLNGEFRYRPYGLLDDTHLRFFTRDTIEELFDKAGLKITTWLRRCLAVDQTEIKFPEHLLTDEILRLFAEDPEADTYQFIVRAVPSSLSPSGSLSLQSTTIAKLNGSHGKPPEPELPAAQPAKEITDELSPERPGLSAEIADLGNQHDSIEERLRSFEGRLYNELLVRRVRSIILRVIPEGKKLLVVSKGDHQLLDMEGRIASPFPQNGTGDFAGWYPEQSSEAIQALEELRTSGNDYLVFPHASMWWLDHYSEFAEHLTGHYRKLYDEPDSCIIYHLTAPSDVRQSSVEMSEAETGIEPATDSVRLIAFYLPQFHPIPENDQWWGKGFTEWTNVTKAKPLFENHYQPHLPADLGYCDLRLGETRDAQAALAREYGIGGFCYYHYWFSGKPLLERPFNEVLTTRQPDFPFCLCWANEPWSRRWDGMPGDVLQEQTYSEEDDLEHIRYLLPALCDSRAILVNNRPLLLVYRARDLPHPARTVELWQREAQKAGLSGIELIAVETGWDPAWDAAPYGFAGKVVFQPQFSVLDNAKRIEVPSLPALRVYDYEETWRTLASSAPAPYPTFPCVFPGWDNSPRRGEQSVVFHNSTPLAYESWLSHAIEVAEQREPSQRIVFINAWNEWGEGAHLEPDLRSGTQYLEATKRALSAAKIAKSH
jgi:hypothetical protein